MRGKRGPRAPNRWRQIWEKKGNEEIKGDSFERLMVYAGFDTATGKIGEDDYRRYVASICSKVRLTQTDTVLEIGCGIGAFLHCLKPTPADIVGIDYSQSIISRSVRLSSNPRIKFYQSEADEFTQLGLGRLDVIFSNSTFFYFPSLEYATRVCQQMMQSLHELGRIAILDVNDVTKKELFLRARYGQIGEAQYKKRYKGLEHLFFDKSFFIQVFQALGCANVLIEDQSWDGSLNSQYRFNVFVQS